MLKKAIREKRPVEHRAEGWIACATYIKQQMASFMKPDDPTMQELSRILEVGKIAAKNLTIFQE